MCCTFYILLKTSFCQSLPTCHITCEKGVGAWLEGMPLFVFLNCAMTCNLIPPCTHCTLQGRAALRAKSKGCASHINDGIFKGLAASQLRYAEYSVS